MNDDEGVGIERTRDKGLKRMIMNGYKNYKETKKKLSEEEKKKLGTLFEPIVQVKELKTGIVKRDSEIQLLKQKLNQLQNEENWQEERHHDISLEEEEDEDINISIDDPEPVSEIEEKIQTDIDAILDENLNFWLRTSSRLERGTRRSSLSNIQEEITMALKEGILEDEIMFSTHQAAKFQGEILNMEQENNRVNKELEAGLDHVKALHHEIKRIL
ncbi:hypothetical protein Tco_0726633 [Tanacetum coccineum]|uniref:NET2A-D/KIP1-like C-terminal domain-containing protein n=1 Tax=Tanacetum coccineum TaxID=301880 RepID=A0ABQ4YIM1_9ASTR